MKDARASRTLRSHDMATNAATAISLPQAVVDALDTPDRHDVWDRACVQRNPDMRSFLPEARCRVCRPDTCAEPNAG